MTYKTILVHVDNSTQIRARVNSAIDLALAHDAHLIGLVMTGISRYAYADRNIFFEEEMKSICKNAEDCLDIFEDIVRASPLTSFERRLIKDEQDVGLALQGRYADLIVLQQPDDGDMRLRSDIAEYVLLNSGKPILVLPDATQFGSENLNVLVAWDGSPQSAKVITFAIPLLKKASQVFVVTCTSSKPSGLDSDKPDSDIACYLNRHNINVDLVHIRSKIPVQELLIKTALESKAGLIIMGGYGHARMREIVLGGVTFSLLRESPIPLFLAN